jgi:signal transduction histidine kinase
MNRKKHGKIFLGILKFALFFMLISFVVTCSFLLFLKTMDGADFAREDIHISAKLTLLNIVFLTILFCVIDTIRRKLTVERNVKNIIKGLDRITKGDFDVKIDIPHDIASENEFDVIAEQINVMTAELKGVETLRTDFIANVSHELKTPLAAINNYGTLLQSPDISADERVKYAKAITDNSRSLANLITNILKLNKLENQQIFPEVKPYNLSEQLCECLLGFENVWERKKLEIDTDIEEDVTVTADSELLSLVWNNLFSNAVKFTDSGGSIFVGLKSENGFAVVTVTDTGCGMSAETGRHIFEKFYQGDTSHAIKGNGLGLALVKRVADITGGEISVQSEVGKGSTFTVKLRE